MAKTNTAELGFEKQKWKAADLLRATWMHQNINQSF